MKFSLAIYTLLKFIHAECEKYLDNPIPEPESFIEADDDYYYKFMQKSMSTLNDSNEIKSVSNVSQKKIRASRWLKIQDRQLIIVQHQLAKVHSKPKSHDFWVKVRDKLQTNRSVAFLRRRYRKLVRKQALNKHEKQFFEENFTRMKVHHFMVAFPGKTKETIENLYLEMEQNKLELAKVDPIIYEKVSRFLIKILSIT